MKISLLLTTLLPLASASPVVQDKAELRGGGRGGKGGKLDFDLVGFAKDNPIGPTTGGEGGKTSVVDTFEALQSAVTGSEKKVVYLKGTLTNPPTRLKVGSNTSLLGWGRGGELIGNGIDVTSSDNVIIRNLGIRKVLNTDALQITNSTRVWVDHNEFESSGLENGPDYNDGQCDIVRGSNWITVSWNYFHDHWKVSEANLQGKDSANFSSHLWLVTATCCAR